MVDRFVFYHGYNIVRSIIQSQDILRQFYCTEVELNAYTQFLDLYTPEEKESFINNAFRETAIKASIIRTELKQLIQFSKTKEFSCWKAGFLIQLQK
jgi:hypothetical protein